MDKTVGRKNGAGAKLGTMDFILCALFAAILAICSVITVPLPFTPIPITLQTLAVCLAGAVLGTKRGVVTIGVYILLGVAGIPVFSGFRSGAGVLLGPTGGYITGFIPGVAAIGFCTAQGTLYYTSTRIKFLITVLSMCVGLAIVYLFGTIQLMIVAHVDFYSAVLSAVIPFLPMDFGKAMGAAMLYIEIQKRAPDLLERNRFSV